MKGMKREIKDKGEGQMSQGIKSKGRLVVLSSGIGKLAELQVLGLQIKSSVLDVKFEMPIKHTIHIKWPACSFASRYAGLNLGRGQGWRGKFGNA